MSVRSVARALAGLAVGAFVASSGVAEADPVPPERVALVLEFLETTETGGGTASLREVFVERIEFTYPRTFEDLLGEMSLSDADRARLEARYDESLARFRDRFARLFDEQVDLEVMARVLYAPIYVRHFSDDELRELIAFYKTPTGRKSLSALPRAMGEVTREVAPAMAPIIASLVAESVAAEKRALAASLASGTDAGSDD